jgi:hypothetical protein
MGHSTSRSRSTASRHNHNHYSTNTRPSTSSSRWSIRRMSSSRKSISPNKPIPAYILDSIQDPDLLADHWYALAELENQRQYAGQESILRTRYAKPPEISRYSIAQSALPENKPKNRYQNVAPYDINGVRVGEDTQEDGMYLNASWVRERAGGALWIASQVSVWRWSHVGNYLTK